MAMSLAKMRSHSGNISSKALVFFSLAQTPFSRALLAREQRSWVDNNTSENLTACLDAPPDQVEL